jgi:hypothetical protein
MNATSPARKFSRAEYGLPDNAADVSFAEQRDDILPKVGDTDEQGADLWSSVGHAFHDQLGVGDRRKGPGSPQNRGPQ